MWGGRETGRQKQGNGEIRKQRDVTTQRHRDTATPQRQRERERERESTANQMSTTFCDTSMCALLYIPLPSYAHPHSPCHVLFMKRERNDSALETIYKRTSQASAELGCGTNMSAQLLGKALLNEGIAHQLYSVFVPRHCHITQDMFTHITGRLTNLRVLAVTTPINPDDRLTEYKISPEVGRLSYLGTLTLQRAAITHLPSSVGQLTAMRALFLNGNHIPRIDDVIGKLTNMIAFRLQANKVRLRYITTELGRLRSLSTLSIGLDRATGTKDALLNGCGDGLAIPSELGLLHNKMAYLYFNGLMVRAIPDMFGQMTNLLRVGFRSNHITVLPQSLAKCSKLNYVSAPDNVIHEWPAFLSRLPRLKKMNLRDNQLNLTTISAPSAQTGDWTSLEHLDIRANGFPAVPPFITPDLFEKKNPLKVNLANNVVSRERHIPCAYSYCTIGTMYESHRTVTCTRIRVFDNKADAFILNITDTRYIDLQTNTNTHTHTHTHRSQQCRTICVPDGHSPSTFGKTPSASTVLSCATATAACLRP